MNRELIKKMNEQREQRRIETEKLLNNIPAIHIEILRYSNNRTKEEVLLKYPENADFINTIVFN